MRFRFKVTRPDFTAGSSSSPAKWLNKFSIGVLHSALLFANPNDGYGNIMAMRCILTIKLVQRLNASSVIIPALISETVTTAGRFVRIFARSHEKGFTTAINFKGSRAIAE